ncbi:phosphatase PAP2 family protein [uncultured Pseudonocardia sp.]|uniref:phosphatase PAP2 family protein n=1 Tax=uncultured Pseudonocardia sp. TaxID=211455 RepID=UPI00263A11D5|nr:phosphatase PAP2 family protein [uncultured Pseudonocardia sp.]
MRGLGDILGGAVEDAQTFLAWANRDGFDAVNTFATHTGWLHPVIVGYASYGVVGFAALLLAGWWLARRAPGTASSCAASSSAPSSPAAGSADGGPARRMAAALWAPVGMLVALGLNQVLVAWVHELRPYTVLPDALVLVARSSDYAFPSDHAVMAGAVAAGVWLVSRRLGYLAAAAALLMAFARVYVGAHWPGDVLVGLVVGTVVTVVGYLLLRTPLTSAVTGLARTRLRPLLTAHPAPEDAALADAEIEPELTQAGQLAASSPRDGGGPQQQASDPTRSETARSDPAQSAAGTWARGPRDTLW